MRAKKCEMEQGLKNCVRQLCKRSNKRGDEMERELVRCKWAQINELEKAYHDTQWGKPEHDDAVLFEMLILEGMQAGLSWDTILKKRENFRLAFDGFDVHKIINYDEQKFEELMQNAGIIRNRLKIRAVISNAKAYLKVREQYGSLDNFLWRYVDFKPIINSWKEMSDVPAKTELSDRISRDMKKLGFTFVGSTIIYAYMQAIGMVNDHTAECFLYGGR